MDENRALQALLTRQQSAMRGKCFSLFSLPVLMGLMAMGLAFPLPLVTSHAGGFHEQQVPTSQCCA